MAGVLATEVASLLKKAHSAFEEIGELYERIAKTKSLPAASPESLPLSSPDSLPPVFHDVGKQAQSICDILRVIREHVQRRENDSTCAEMKPFAEECKSKAECLEKLFSKVIPSPADKKMECYRMMVKSMGGESRVEELMLAAMKNIKQLLTIDDKMKSATETQLELLKKSMQEVSEIPQSLEDESPPALGIHNYGSGPQNVHAGNGPQNNNNDKGVQVTGGTYNNHRQ